MKTNFEKWKNTLTPDDDVVMFGIAGVNCKAKCPALQYCITKRKKKPITSLFKDGWTCKRVFTTWAKKPVKEEE